MACLKATDKLLIYASLHFEKSTRIELKKMLKFRLYFFKKNCRIVDFEKEIFRLSIITPIFLLAILFLSVSGKADDISSNGKTKGENEYLSPIGNDSVRIQEIEEDYEPKIKRIVVPPFYQEKTDKYKLQLFFPLFVRKYSLINSEKYSIGIFPLLWRSIDGDKSTNVIFPLYTRIRSSNSKTDIILQTYYKRGVEGYHFGLAPILFIGKNVNKNSTYQIIPPIFWRFEKEEKSFLLAGIFFLKKEKDNYNFGLPPLVFGGKDNWKSYLTIAPPLFFRFQNDLNYETKTIIPPFFVISRQNGWSFGALPLLYLARDKDWDKTLLIPFYYGNREQYINANGEVIGELKSSYLPLLLTYFRKAPGLKQGGVALFYHWYWKEGDYLRMYSPLVWRYGNERNEEHTTLVPPIAYYKKSPVEKNLMLGLIYWDFHDKYKKRTIAIMPFAGHSKSLHSNERRTWIAPSFDFGVGEENKKFFRFHPIFYWGKDYEKQHLVISPIFWKFKDPEDDRLVVFPFYWKFKDLLHDDKAQIFFPIWWKFDDPRRENKSRIVFPLIWDIERGKKNSRITIGVPLYWRYRINDRSTTGILNVWLNKGEIKNNKYWTFNIFPLVAFGNPPSQDGTYWSVFAGLAEWRRQGSSKRMKIFWIPINIDSK